MLMNYAKTIKKLRNKLLLTQKEFADFLGVKLVTVSRWESGKFEPTMKTKRKLRDLFEKNYIEIEVSKQWLQEE